MERATPILPVADLRIAKAFYIDQLGFSVRFETSESPTRGLLGVERGTICLTLDCPMDGHGKEACVALEVENADAYYDAWRQNVAVARPPKDEAWGARTFEVVDPFGNTLFVIGPPAAALSA